MGFKSLVLILIFAILSVSCSTINFSTQPDVTKRNYSNFNYYCSKQSSKIIFLNGENISVKYANIKGDSLYYCAENDTLSSPINVVEKVVIKRWIGAIAEGFFLGLATTIFTAFIFIKLASGEGDLGAALVGISVGLLAGFVTLILGIIHGGKSEYIFNGDYVEFDETNEINEEVRIRMLENYKKQIKYFEEKTKQDSTNLGS